MGFPEELKTWRQKQGLTQAEAAELFQVTETSFANWEVGRKAPRGLTRTRVLETIQDGEGGATRRELARFNFALGEHFATLTLRGERLEPEDFDRLKAAVGRLQALLGRPDSGPEKPVRAKKRPATPGSKPRSAGHASGKPKQAG